MAAAPTCGPILASMSRTRILSAASRAAALALSLVLVAASVLAVGCGGRPSTPEALFAEVARLNERGETGKIWDLMTDEARKSFIDSIDGYRDWIRRNPNDPTDKLHRQFNAERQEILVLDYKELFHRENLGRERVLVGAKIIDKVPDTTRPDEEVLSIQAVGG